MAYYAVGDLQGCLDPLLCLLNQVQFNPLKDQLWIVGDLINRGPQSKQTLDYLMDLAAQHPNSLRVVLGNHDLNFVAVTLGYAKAKSKDTLNELLASKCCEEYAEWLCQQPLLYHDKQLEITMTHAGIPPIWSLAEAKQFAQEVHDVLRSPQQREQFFAHMYGNQPDQWDNSLSGWPRLRLITNYFTRMRFCDVNGKLDLSNKTATSDNSDFAPWFSYSKRKTRNDTLLFGHWAALEGYKQQGKLHGLDTGCVWGGHLTLLNLQTFVEYHCDC